MPVRAQTLVDLWKELLGPRNGPRELIAEDPRGEYITGVLRPEPPARAVPAQPDPDQDAPELVAGPESEDDDDDAFVGGAPVSPSIDPTQLPRSIGLSFALAGDTPSFRLCCSWARYRRLDTGQWERQPECMLTDWLDALVNHQRFEQNGAHVLIETSPLTNGHRITVYLVNAVQQTEPLRPDTAEHFFQPQIRVRLREGTALQRLVGSNLSDDDEIGEERQLELLYDRREAFARGHMCSAVWREIDPEREAGPNVSDRPQCGPFVFQDAALLGPGISVDFSPADVRTEFIPIYAVEAPETVWRDEGQGSPMLLAGTLAEQWTPEQLELALRPLERSYRAWLIRQHARTGSVPTRLQAISIANLNSCATFADRLNDAIELLKTDENARLAFCFANQAMAIQGRWSRNRDLEWRPFQLAFFLTTLRSAAYPHCPAREVCDLLWFPTGGGKTEAYLALAAFTLAFRRLRDGTGGGTAVISRYTLRLLTIQQFRRALAMITACELLRVHNLGSPGGLVGWRPNQSTRSDTFIWGGERFSAGLWVGGGVTPNRLDSLEARIDNAQHLFLGATDILKGARPGYRGRDPSVTRLLRGKRVHSGGEPAQIANCPCCKTTLALPDGDGDGDGMPAGVHVIYVPHSDRPDLVNPAQLASLDAGIAATAIASRAMGDGFVTAVTVSIQHGASLGAQYFDEWWHDVLAPLLGPGDLLCARPSRAGYVLVRRDGPQSAIYGFEALCPNPSCELNQNAWAENLPVLRSARRANNIPDRSFSSPAHADLPSLSGHWQDPPLLLGRLSQRVFGRIPIPGQTVDDQIYSHPPSLLVATADKFARIAYEPRAAAIFGNVSHYHARFGYYRAGAWPSGLEQVYRPHPPGGPGGHAQLHRPVDRFDPPDLIIQDELHLIEGPLGSMVGIYETAVELLAMNGAHGPKYVASTATIRQAGPQVRALFDREVAQFPPQAIDIDDSFFARTSEPHPLNEATAGRLYVGVAAPGKGAQTPIVRVWSSLLQSAMTTRHAPPSEDPDRLWTLAAYFNAVRELAGAATLYRQDIPERMRHRYPAGPRPTEPDGYMELSSRADSIRLPAMLGALEIPGRIDVVCATSMFGTGVDIDRLGLMVIHGQPKTTSTYIQATGRVGRRSGALVVTFLRASRPRDLDHYEFFCGYHRALYRYVEPISVSPFAPKARERCLGPISVAMLRQASQISGHLVSDDWLVEQRLAGQQFHSEARRMRDHRRDREVDAIPQVMERRAQAQPLDVRPPSDVTRVETESELDVWQQMGRRSLSRDDLVYSEPAVTRAPTRNVILGDPQHEGAGLSEAYQNALQSLRAIEATTTLKT